MRRVGSYEIIGELGRGGMAVVHLGRRADGQLLALKELAGFHSGDQNATHRFLREAVVGSSLSHSNIVAVYERFEDRGIRPRVLEVEDLEALQRQRVLDVIEQIRVPAAFHPFAETA